MEKMKIEEWLNNNSYYGYGSSYSYGLGYVCGDDSGSGWGDGSGSGWGDSSGCGWGDGLGYGSSYGDGSGSSYGLGSCCGIKKFSNDYVFEIDNVRTIIKHIKENVAKGFILNNDFTLAPCFICKGNGYFAHGKTLKEARQALVGKYLEGMDEKEVIDRFLLEFDSEKSYKGTVFFEWHNYLTGSCLIGRESFVRNHDLDLNKCFTVEEFFNLCRDDYGGNVIKELEKRWNESKSESEV